MFFLKLMLILFSFSLCKTFETTKTYDYFELIFNSDLKTWYEARDYCKSLDGGNLIDFENPRYKGTFNDFLKHVNANETDKFWLGAKESHRNNEFIWDASGKSFSYDIKEIKNQAEIHEPYCLCINELTDKPELCNNRAYSICIKLDKCRKKNTFEENGRRYDFDPNIDQLTYDQAKSKCTNLLTIQSKEQLKGMKPFLDDIFHCDNRVSFWINLSKRDIDSDFANFSFTLSLWGKGSPKSDDNYKNIRLVRSALGEYILEDVNRFKQSSVICMTHLNSSVTQKEDITINCHGSSIYSFDGHKYFYNGQYKTYNEAKITCQIKNMHLLEIQTAEDNFRVLPLLSAITKQCPEHSQESWLGAKKIFKEFYWNSNNKKFDYEYHVENRHNQPYMYGNDCLIIGPVYSNFRWFSYICEFEKPFICYKKTNDEII